MMRLRVFLSCPITLGDREHNFNQAVDASKALIDAGHSPYNPALTMKYPWAWDVPHETWMEMSLPWVLVSDCVLRLPGKSRGADEEVAFAKENDIPVFTTIESLCDWAET